MDGLARHNMPNPQPMLQRSRITAQLERAFQCALITVVAPTGYGKTHEIANHLKNADARRVWMRITKLDNLPEHFWSHYTAALEFEFPEMARSLRDLGFPDTLAKMESWLRRVAGELYRDSRPTVFVMDEFDQLNSKEVLTPIEYRVKIGVEDSSLVLISRQRTRYDMDALQSGAGVSRITEKQLKFTAEDIEEFFMLSGIHLPPDEIALIHKETDGWPLLVNLLSRQLKEDPSLAREFFLESLDVIYSMFEADFFSRYDASTKKALAALAALPSFSASLIEKVGGVDVAAFTELLRYNTFVSFNAKSREYIFQNSYRDFLINNQNEADIARIQSIAGDYALSRGEQLDAIECYSKCERYHDMLDVMVDFIAARMGIDRPQIEYFSGKLAELPLQVKEGNYLARYIEVCLLIQMLQTGRAQEILDRMEAELLQEPWEKERAMLGEVYDRMAGIAMMNKQERFVEYYKKAYEYIPNGSAYKKKSMLRYKNYSIVALQDYGPGAMERMEKAVYEGFAYMNAVENGASAGYQYLFSAEAAYYRFELKHALNMAHKALYEAECGKAHDIVCNALTLLARISLMRGKYEDVMEYLHRLEGYVEEVGISGLKDVVEFSRMWLDLSLGANAPNSMWIRSVDAVITTNAPLVIGREECLYAVFLLHKKRYSELVAYLEQVRPWYETKGWGDSLTIGIMLSIGYLKLGDEERAIDTLKETYDQAYCNGIITPYIEFGSMMRTLIEHVRRSARDGFDPAWLDNILAKSITCAKRLSFMVKEYTKQNDAVDPMANVRLSDREMDVLRNLAQGLTREEVAEENGIKGSTVKSIIRGIYNKLGAMNRADAIRIALESNILK